MDEKHKGATDTIAIKGTQHCTWTLFQEVEYDFLKRFRSTLARTNKMKTSATLIMYFPILLLFGHPSSIFSKDIITLKNGTFLECNVISYSNGLFTVVNSDGDTVTGSANSVASITFAQPMPTAQTPPDILQKLSPADFPVSGTLGAACNTDEQKAALARFAADTFTRPIESITLMNNWGHPADRAVAVVNFKRSELYGEYFESARALIYHQDRPPKWPPKDNDGNIIWGPKENDISAGPWFTDKKIMRDLHVRYRVKGVELYLRPSGNHASYNDIHKLLLCILERDYEANEHLADITIDISRIIAIDVEKKESTLSFTISTSSGGLSGSIYVFEKHEGTFKLVGFGGWVS